MRARRPKSMSSGETAGCMSMRPRVTACGVMCMEAGGVWCGKDDWGAMGAAEACPGVSGSARMGLEGVWGSGRKK